MLKSLKEKVVPSLIAMIVVGGFGAFVTQRVMAKQLEYYELELAKKASIESVTNLEKSSEDKIESIKEVLDKKASKEVQDIILNKIEGIDKKLDRALLLADK